jgi:hypothetical protein
MAGSGMTGATAFAGASPIVPVPAPLKPAASGTSGAIALTGLTAPTITQTSTGASPPNVILPWDKVAAPAKAAAAPAKITATSSAPITNPAPQRSAALTTTPAPIALPPQTQSAYTPPAPSAAGAPLGGTSTAFPPQAAIGAAVPAVNGAATTSPRAIAPAQIASAEPATTPAPAWAPASAPPTVGTGAFLIQVAAYKDESVAQSVARDVNAKAGDLLGDTSGNIQRADLGEKGVYYRIQYGPFASRGVATERCARLKARGLACIIVAGARS